MSDICTLDYLLRWNLTYNNALITFKVTTDDPVDGCKLEVVYQTPIFRKVNDMNIYNHIFGFDSITYPDVVYYDNDNIPWNTHNIKKMIRDIDKFSIFVRGCDTSQDNRPILKTDIENKELFLEWIDNAFVRKINSKLFNTFKLAYVECDIEHKETISNDGLFKAPASLHKRSGFVTYGSPGDLRGSFYYHYSPATDNVFNMYSLDNNYKESVVVKSYQVKQLIPLEFALTFAPGGLISLGLTPGVRDQLIKLLPGWTAKKVGVVPAEMQQ